MVKLNLSNNKTLKLTNCLIIKIELSDDFDLNTSVIQMENYIKSKGAMPIGPLIQKTKFEMDKEGNPEISISLIRQANNFIHNVEEPYKMESVIRVKDCLYVRYSGPEEKLKFAYDKINLFAFEEDIELANENYTIFVDQQDDTLIADVFVEKVKENGTN